MKSVLVVGLFCLVCLLGFGIWYYSDPSPEPASDESSVPPDGIPVPIYFYQQATDVDQNGNLLCSRKGVVSVRRYLPPSHTLADRIELVLGGKLTANERAQGIATEYPLAGVRLVSAVIENRKAILTFEDVLGKTRGGACRSAILWYQLEQTALSFGEVRDVEFRPSSLFQP